MSLQVVKPQTQLRPMPFREDHGLRLHAQWRDPVPADKPQEPGLVLSRPPTVATAVLPGSFWSQGCWTWSAQGRVTQLELDGKNRLKSVPFDGLPAWKTTPHGTRIKLPRTVLTRSGAVLLQKSHPLDGAMARMPLTQSTTSLGARMAVAAGLEAGKDFAPLVPHGEMVQSLARHFTPVLGRGEAPGIDLWFTQAAAEEVEGQRPRFAKLVAEAAGRQPAVGWLPADGNIWGLQPGLMPTVDPWRESNLRLHAFPTDLPWRMAAPRHLLGTVSASSVAPRFRWDLEGRFMPAFEPEHDLGITPGWEVAQSRSYGMTACVIASALVRETGDGVTVHPITNEFLNRVRDGYFGPVLLGGYEPAGDGKNLVPRIPDEAFVSAPVTDFRMRFPRPEIQFTEGHFARHAGRMVFGVDDFGDAGEVVARFPSGKNFVRSNEKVQRTYDCQAVPLPEEDTRQLLPLVERATREMRVGLAHDLNLLRPLPYQIPLAPEGQGGEVIACFQSALHHIQGTRCVGLNVLDRLLHMSTGTRPGWAMHHETWHGIPNGVFGPFPSNSSTGWDQAWVVADIDAPGWKATLEDLARAEMVCRLGDRPQPFGRVDTNEMPRGESVALAKATLATAERLGFKRWSRVEDHDFNVVLVVSRLGSDGVREYDAYKASAFALRGARRRRHQDAVGCLLFREGVWDQVEAAVRVVAHEKFPLHAHEDATEHPRGLLPEALGALRDEIKGAKSALGKRWILVAKPHFEKLLPDQNPLWFPYEPVLEPRHFSACIRKSPALRQGLRDGWNPESLTEEPLWEMWAHLWRLYALGALQEHPDQVWKAIFLRWRDAETMPTIEHALDFLQRHVMTMGDGQFALRPEFVAALKGPVEPEPRFWSDLHRVSWVNRIKLNAVWTFRRACEAVRFHSPFRFQWSWLPAPVRILGEFPIWLLCPIYLLLRQGKNRWFDFDLLEGQLGRAMRLVLAPMRLITMQNLILAYAAVVLIAAVGGIVAVTVASAFHGILGTFFNALGGIFRGAFTLVR